MFAATSFGTASLARRKADRRGSTAAIRAVPSGSGPKTATQSPTANSTSLSVRTRTSAEPVMTVHMPRSTRDTRAGLTRGSPRWTSAAIQSWSQPRAIRPGAANFNYQTVDLPSMPRAAVVPDERQRHPTGPIGIIVDATGAAPLPSADMDVLLREYDPGDYHACRRLWTELTEHHRQIYGDATIGGDDPGAGFDEYLRLPERLTSWVVGVEGDVIGLTGLLDRGTSAEVEPVVVTGAWRRRGIGRRLIEQAVAEAQRVGYEYLCIRPVARNVAAIQSFHDVGFRTLGGHVDLTMDLRDRKHRWVEGVNLHGRPFRY
jgi:GNAT superfamily N-acetyltransferase